MHCINILPLLPTNQPIYVGSVLGAWLQGVYLEPSGLNANVKLHFPSMIMDKCPLCFKKILAHSKNIECTICNETYRLNCVTLSPEERDYLQTTIWYRTLCTSSLFNGFEDDSHFREAIEELGASTLAVPEQLSNGGGKNVGHSPIESGTDF